MGIYTNGIAGKEKSKKEIEYENYIREHIKNVRTAYKKYGVELCRLLDVDPTELAVRIDSHDNSKFYGSEFEGYRQKFYPQENENIDNVKFNTAWLYHIHRNSHHPEHWCYVDDNFKVIVLDMPTIDIIEMLLDWEAMSIKFDNNTYDYYMKTRDVKPFSENTKKVIDSVIEIFR